MHSSFFLGSFKFPFDGVPIYKQISGFFYPKPFRRTLLPHTKPQPMMKQNDNNVADLCRNQIRTASHLLTLCDPLIAWGWQRQLFSLGSYLDSVYTAPRSKRSFIPGTS
ncbi:hypothetical protein TNCT_82711 [Trichonephila clavata]|uniref:Uncharacterized protein n=1 Tax=Trichonephila clavata TaxID=2740835 RepID=A0A8X6L9F8_TRICU|nr:hypothetical protein TNCT_82711 [Trichonephila clavata]